MYQNFVLNDVLWSYIIIFVDTMFVKDELPSSKAGQDSGTPGATILSEGYRWDRIQSNLGKATAVSIAATLLVLQLLIGCRINPAIKDHL